MRKYFLTLYFGAASFCLFAQYGVFSDPITGKEGYRNPVTGELLVPAIYDDVQPWAGDSLITVTSNGKRGIISEQHKIRVPVEFDNLNLRTEVGRQLGFVGTSREGQWGLYQFREGREVLPNQFTFVRALQPDLVVARQPDSDSLVFFDGRGQTLFRVSGSMAFPGYDAETVEIQASDKRRYFVDRNGNDPFAGKFPFGRWTNGKRVIVASVSQYGNADQFGLLDSRGDTLLDCHFQSIEPISDDRFLVTSTDRKAGLVDENGVFLIPLMQGELLQITNQPDAALVFRDRGDFTQKVYDISGKLVIRDCRTANPDPPYNRYIQPPTRHPDQYFIAYRADSESTGLFHADGRPILPMQYRRIKYASDQHPFIVMQDDAYRIVDWENQALSAYRFQQLAYTADPTIFFGQSTEATGMGFIFLDQPDQPNPFRYEQIRFVNRSHYFIVRDSGLYYLHNPEAERVCEEGFEYIKSPQPEHYRAWQKKEVSGALLAMGRRPAGTSGTRWVGFDDAGNIFDFTASELESEVHEEEEEIFLDESAPDRGAP